MTPFSHIKPPKWPLGFLKFYLKKEYLEEIEGDMEEVFQEYLELTSPKKASRMYTWEVFKLLRFNLIKNSHLFSHSNELDMFKNNLKIAWRSMLRNKGYTAINILGLTIGIAFSAILYTYIDQELSFDAFHEKADRTYRVVTTDKRNPENLSFHGQTSPPLGPLLAADFPQVEVSTRLFKPIGQIIFELDGEKIMERDWFVAGPNFFSTFDFEFSHGDRQKALTEPNSVVLSSSAAIRYFGSGEKALDQILQSGDGSFRVTGVLEPIPANSHLQFEVLTSIPGGKNYQNYLSDWRSYGAFTYVVIKDGAPIEELSASMPQFFDKYVSDASSFFDTNFQPIQDIYLGSNDIQHGAEKLRGNISYVYIFSSMGILILVLACVNYINLMTAGAMNRAKEVGVRKTLGALKGQLRIQFLTESFLVTFIAMTLALGLMDIVFPYFNQINSTSFDVTWSNLTTYLPTLFVLSIVIAILAGAFPAFYLSLLSPTQAIKRGIAGTLSKTAILRKSLVVFQFSITVILLVSTIVINQQLGFIQNTNIGFDKEQLLVIDINSGNVRRKFQTVKAKFAKIPGVSSVGVSTRVPGEWKNIAKGYFKSSTLSPEDSVESYVMGFDEGMLDAYKMEMVSGEYFVSNTKNDSTKVILNEAAVRAFNLSDPVGSFVETSLNNGKDFKVQVVGVIKDFHFQSLHEKVAPLAIGAWNTPLGYIDYFTLKYTGEMNDVVKQAQAVHDKFDPNSPMEYNLLNDRLEDFYQQETRASLIFNMSVLLSLVVASLGLFGLSAYMADQRSKEISIRKVLGASVNSLLGLMTFDFLKLVLISVVVATPICWYVVDDWLGSFAYRIDIELWYFLAAAAAVLAVAFITVLSRSLKVTMSNPVDSLKDE
ncbi:MAG: ABC transporter permease [Cyclobacteriaceae bacterium]